MVMLHNIMLVLFQGHNQVKIGAQSVMYKATGGLYCDIGIICL